MLVFYESLHGLIGGGVPIESGIRGYGENAEDFGIASGAA